MVCHRYIFPIDHRTKISGKTGSFCEEVEAATGKQLGDLPQTFSHVGLIGIVLYLGHVNGKLRAGRTPTRAKESGVYRWY